MAFQTAHEHNRDVPPKLAVALGGGGARAAYQVGVLRGIATKFPDLATPILTGVSAGGINVSFLANHTGTFRQKVHDLSLLWKELSFSDVFEVRPAQLLWQVARVGMRLSIGAPPGIPKVTGMVDTEPLRQFLKRTLNACDGKLPGIAQNLANGRLQAVALTALNYGTGETVTFVEGRAITEWERPLRISVNTSLTIDHTMASAALPLLFPPVKIGDYWYGDGGIRLVAPLSPAVHLNPDRLLVISTHYDLPRGSPVQPQHEHPPSPAVVMGALYNAVFLDQLDQDVLQMNRINTLLPRIPPEHRQGLRKIETVVVRPSQNIGKLANAYESRLPRTFRYFMRRLGSREASDQDFISTVMFHRDYISELLTLGERDAIAQMDRIAPHLA
ncbi:MAG: patatin-like phospholipase family protein [Planctomycetaceae bacterium]